MRTKRYFMSGGIVVISSGFLILILTVILSLFNRIHLLPWDPMFAIPIALILFMMCISIGSALIWFDTSWVTRLHRHQQPYEPDDDTIVRVVVADGFKGEYFVYGELDDTVREAIERDWPFRKNLKGKEWFVLDGTGVDVTEKSYIDVEGTLRVVFD